MAQGFRETTKFGKNFEASAGKVLSANFLNEKERYEMHSPVPTRSASSRKGVVVPIMSYFFITFFIGGILWLLLRNRPKLRKRIFTIILVPVASVICPMFFDVFFVIFVFWSIILLVIGFFTLNVDTMKESLKIAYMHIEFLIWGFSMSKCVLTNAFVFNWSFCFCYMIWNSRIDDASFYQISPILFMMWAMAAFASYYCGVMWYEGLFKEKIWPLRFRSKRSKKRSKRKIYVLLKR